jgi:hypothetical protein
MRISPRAPIMRESLTKGGWREMGGRGHGKVKTRGTAPGQRRAQGLVCRKGQEDKAKHKETRVHRSLSTWELGNSMCGDRSHADPTSAQRVLRPTSQVEACPYPPGADTLDMGSWEQRASSIIVPPTIAPDPSAIVDLA